MNQIDKHKQLKKQVYTNEMEIMLYLFLNERTNTDEVININIMQLDIKLYQEILSYFLEMFYLNYIDLRGPQISQIDIKFREFRKEFTHIAYDYQNKYSIQDKFYSLAIVFIF